MILPLLLLAITLFLTYLFVLSSSRSMGVRGSILITFIVAGAYMVVSMELLSAFDALTPGNMTGVWLAAAAVLTVVGVRSRRLGDGWYKFEQALQTFERSDRFFLGLFGIGSGLLLLVALKSPPNNYDSLHYHLARVVHWAQNGNLGHYVTANEQQLYMPPLAEMAVLNLRLLWGDDSLAGLVQWASMVACLAGVSWIIKRMGLSRVYQWFGAAAAFAIPMGILQATSTQNDYAASFFVVSLAAFITDSKFEAGQQIWRVVLIGLATGLGVLTKGTFVVYAAPLLIWYFLPFPRSGHRARWIATGAAVVVVVIILNFGHWLRNFNTYGGILGSPQDVSRFIRIVETDSGDDALQEGLNQDNGAGQDGGPGSLLVEWRQKLSSMLVWHLITPVGWWNTRWIGFVESHPDWFPTEYVENIDWAAWNHEDTAGNPVHLMLVPITLGVVLLRRKEIKNVSVPAYMLTILTMMPLLAIIIANSPYLWSVRFQLSFFILWSPVTAVAVSLIASDRRVVQLGALGFLALAIPWVLLNGTRPVIGVPPWPTRIESVFTTSDLEIITAFDPNGIEFYTELRDRLQSYECSSIGLQIDSTDPEYLYWWLVDAPQSGVRVEAVDAYERLERYLDPDFAPCLILCTTCGGRQDLMGLERGWEGGNVVIFEP